MGSKFSTRKGNRGSSRSVGSDSRRGVSTASYPSMSSQASMGSRGKKSLDRKASVKQKYGFIPDTFSSLEEVCFPSFSSSSFQFIRDFTS
jgi:hypothetical protein